MSEATASTTKHCAGRRKDGAPCGVTMLADASYCFAHSPARQQDRTEARARGGRNRSSAVRLRGLVPPRLAGVYERLETALDEVHRGELDPKVAGAMAALSRAMVAVLTSGELECRVRALEGRESA